MNPYHRLALPLIFAGLLAACAPAADLATGAPVQTPQAQTPQATSSSPPAASPTVPLETESAEPTSTPHDMGEMSDGETVTVDIANFAFVPNELVISAGTEVVFTNSDSAPHTVTAGSDDEPMPELFDSGLLEQGETFSFVFEDAGEFAYFCDRHPPMTATVVVEN